MRQPVFVVICFGCLLCHCEELSDEAIRTKKSDCHSRFYGFVMTDYCNLLLAAICGKQLLIEQICIYRKSAEASSIWRRGLRHIVKQIEQRGFNFSYRRRRIIAFALPFSDESLAFGIIGFFVVPVNINTARNKVNKEQNQRNKGYINAHIKPGGGIGKADNARTRGY